MGISKNQIKFISQLQQKKFRNQEKLFVVEGEKLLEELLQDKNCRIRQILGLEDWIEEHAVLLNEQGRSYEVISGKTLERISGLRSPNKVLAVVEQQSPVLPHAAALAPQLSLVLDKLQDPGNLGTVIRIADWFGIEHIFASPDTVEVYNPKVIQSTMGSFLRVKVHYIELPQLFEQYPEIPRYGALLEGRNVFEADLPKGAMLIIGNESKGISTGIQKSINHPIMIPRYGAAESLNAAIATGILCAAFKK